MIPLFRFEILQMPEYPETPFTKEHVCPTIEKCGGQSLPPPLHELKINFSTHDSVAFSVSALGQLLRSAGLVGGFWWLLLLLMSATIVF